MATETIEEFLARGGKVQKSSEETTLESLLYNTGLLNHNEAENTKNNITNSIDLALKSQLEKTTKK